MSSLWSDQVGPRPSRAPLRGDTDADVAVVGAGYTGLWTAYYLHELDPSLRVVVLEAETAGFGASGRNGGWCSALYPVGLAQLRREVGDSRAAAQYLAMRDSVTEIERVCAKEGIDCDYALGGTVVVARSAAQLERARAEADEYPDVDLLDAPAARTRLNATDVLGATYTPHCAAIQPVKLVRGLAEVVAARGVTIAEHTRATSLERGVVQTERGRITAPAIVRATEGYTPRLAARDVVPVYSLIIATEPLPPSVWDDIGLRDRETFSDHRHLIVYGQRTADDRMVFGGRGAPYHFGSRIASSFDSEPRVFAALERTLHELFPVLRGRAITHRWGGPLGITRDWHPSVGFADGMGWGGGYVGDGVSTANLAGRTLADLVLGRGTALTALPWVGHRSRRWEPEPLRWLGANAALRAMAWADRAEAHGHGPSRVAAVVERVIGH